MSFSVTLNNRIRIRSFWLDDNRQRELGEFAIATIKKRIQGGVNVNDQPAARLSPMYEKRKLRRGLSGLRDLTATGAMLNNIQVIGVGGSIKIGFSDPRQAFKAGVNQGREKMIGLSRFDQRAVIEKHDEIFAAMVDDFVEALTA